MILERLAYHPIAIMQAGVYMQKRTLGLRKFMKYYKDQKERLLTNAPLVSPYKKSLDNNKKETYLKVFTT